eukprot:COSAG01_NODE_445_length_16991_cov_24.504262_3_plen_64_part_00
MSQLPRIRRAVAAGREKRKEILFFPPPSILRAQADPAFGVLGRIFRAVTGWFLLVGVARVGRP